MSLPESHRIESGSKQNPSQPLPPVDVLDYVLFPCFLLAFVSTLIIFHILQLCALPLGRKPHDRVIHELNHWLVGSMAILGVRFDIKKHQARLDPNKSYIIVSNHQSLFDIPLLFKVFAEVHPRFIAKKELSRGVPSVSLNLRRGWNVIIDRQNPKQAIKAIKSFAQLANEHRLSVVIFPEGTRGRDGELKDFRLSGFKALYDNMDDPQVILVTLDGSWKLAARTKGPITRGVTFSVRTKQIETKNKTAGDLLADLQEQSRVELQTIRAHSS